MNGLCPCPAVRRLDDDAFAFGKREPNAVVKQVRPVLHERPRNDDLVVCGPGDCIYELRRFDFKRSHNLRGHGLHAGIVTKATRLRKAVCNSGVAEG